MARPPRANDEDRTDGADGADGANDDDAAPPPRRPRPGDVDAAAEALAEPDRIIERGRLRPFDGTITGADPFAIVADGAILREDGEAVEWGEARTLIAKHPDVTVIPVEQLLTPGPRRRAHPLFRRRGSSAASAAASSSGWRASRSRRRRTSTTRITPQRSPPSSSTASRRWARRRRTSTARRTRCRSRRCSRRRRAARCACAPASS